jgi:hypothetical protein
MLNIVINLSLNQKDDQAYTAGDEQKQAYSGHLVTHARD